MTPFLADKDAVAGAARTGEYARYRPEQTRLYAREQTLPSHGQREFEDYLKCDRLEHHFLRVRCAHCHAERLMAFSANGAASARAAVRAGRRKAQPCWSTK